MLKIKLCLITMAIVISIVGAFAGSSKNFCEYQQQYHKFGSSYMPVGEYGVDYFCYNTAGTCTYYQVTPGSFAPCRTGGFSWAPYK